MRPIRQWATSCTYFVEAPFNARVREAYIATKEAQRVAWLAALFREDFDTDADYDSAIAAVTEASTLTAEDEVTITQLQQEGLERFTNHLLNEPTLTLGTIVQEAYDG